MSDQGRNDTPEMQAMHQLEQLVRHLGEELASFRRRALQAEGRLKLYESSTKPGDQFTEQRASVLERENADLRARLAFATERARGVLEQVRFLRQQATRPGATAAAER